MLERSSPIRIFNVTSKYYGEILNQVLSEALPQREIHVKSNLDPHPIPPPTLIFGGRKKAIREAKKQIKDTQYTHGEILDVEVAIIQSVKAFENVEKNSSLEPAERKKIKWEDAVKRLNNPDDELKGVSFELKSVIYAKHPHDPSSTQQSETVVLGRKDLNKLRRSVKRHIKIEHLREDLAKLQGHNQNQREQILKELSELGNEKPLLLKSLTLRRPISSAVTEVLLNTKKIESFEVENIID